MALRILVTGGAGFIGSFTTLALLEAGHHPVVLDNFCNAHPSVLERITNLAGRQPPLVEADVRDGAAVAAALAQHGIEAVMHFAGLKAVGASVQQPLHYYDNNLSGTITLLQAMREQRVQTLVFSSSATVYDAADAAMPLAEGARLGCTSPYGRSKHMVEQVLADAAAAFPDLSLCALRYFNPAGAHPSGTMGEDPRGVPNNLVPYIAQVAVGRQEALGIFGDDWPTPDGTGVRDYIHVLDLAQGHVRALDHVHGRAGLQVFNLGRGQGHSVREVLGAFSRACGFALPARVLPRRPGDVARMWADPALARETLGFTAERTLQQMCDDVWRWQSANPEGYAHAGDRH